MNCLANAHTAVMPRSSRFFLVATIAWATSSPLLWWHTISDRYGAPIPWEFMAQLASLGVAGLLALPGLWCGVRLTAWALIAAVATVVLSLAIVPSAMPAGLLMNSALLCAAAGLVLRPKRKGSPPAGRTDQTSSPNS